MSVHYDVKQNHVIVVMTPDDARDLAEKVDEGRWDVYLAKELRKAFEEAAYAKGVRR